MAKAKGFKKAELDLFNNRLNTLKRVAEEELPQILKETVDNIKRDVIASAPLAGGNLRNSVYTELNDNGAKVEIDTTKTETRRSSRRFNYGYTVEHGRGGEGGYKTTPYWYDNVMRNLSLIDKKIKNVLAKAAMSKTK